MMVFQDLLLRKVNSYKVIAITVCLCLLLSTTVHAQKPLDSRQKHAQKQVSQLYEQRLNSESGNEPLMMLNGVHTGNNPLLQRHLDLEKRYGREISEGYGYWIGTEPRFAQIKFFKLDEPATLSQRVDAVLYGVTVSLPPEYDMYGYEMRRYMSAISGPEVLVSRKRLAAEIANTQRAKIMLEHWEKELTEYMNKIAAEIEADDQIDSATRTSFRFKSGKVRAFMIEANSWVDNNQAMLQMLYDAWGVYEYRDPYINFKNKADLDRFAKLFRAREKSLQIIKEYPPFRMMVY